MKFNSLQLFQSANNRLRTLCACLWSCLILIFLSSATLPLYAQQEANQKFDFSVQEMALPEVFALLATQQKVNFSYNTGELQTVSPITYQGKQQSLREHLTAILNPSGYYFRFVGNQIVIFKPGNNRPVPPQPIEEISADSQQMLRPDTLLAGSRITPPEVIRDTIFRYERIIRTDTIVKIDTLVITDTVYITIEPKRETEPRSSLRFEPDRRKGWSAGVYAGPVYNSFQFSAAAQQSGLLALLEEAEEVSVRNLVAGVGINYHTDAWTFNGSLQLSGFANRFRHSYEQTTGGYFEVDTLDTYYTVVLNDTTWIYITDSTYLPLDKKAYSISQFNTFGYLDMQLGIQYTLYRKRDFRLYAKSAIMAGRLIYAGGSSINPSAGYVEIDFNELEIRKVLFSWQAGIGFRHRLSDWIDLTAEAWYRGSVNTVFSDYPIDRRFRAVGVQAGILYYF